VKKKELIINSGVKEYLIECIESGWIPSEGPFVKKFEEQFSAHIGRKFGIVVSSDTVA